MIPPHLRPLAEATYEALGRASRGEPIGEPDLRNALLFSHQLIAEFAKYGIVVSPVDILKEGYTVQPSIMARSGPALLPQGGITRVPGR